MGNGTTLAAGERRNLLLQRPLIWTKTIVLVFGGAAPEQVTLTGTGLGLSAAPSSLNFAGVKVGTASTQSLLISNSDITISQINVNAKDVTVSGVTLPVSLSATQSLNATVQFKPLTSESVTGTITLLDSLGGSLELT